MTLPRDGTSQKGRALAALDPDYARVDERTTEDLIAFARQYSERLKYFAPDNPEQAQGTWGDFIGKDTSQPRPHLALFLAFLELLGLARAQLNTLTRRHLEFHFRDVLRMVRKRPVPDKVHLLVELDARTAELRVPEGTALRAGKDSLGRELTYRTDRELVANRVEVGRISTLRADVRRTGVRETARPGMVGGLRQQAFVDMLRIALGEPKPGDPLPIPPYPPGVQYGGVDFKVLQQMLALIERVDSQLGIRRLDDFRALMRLRDQRSTKSEDAEWKTIEGALLGAGQKRVSTFSADQLKREASLQDNLMVALGLKAPEEFQRLFETLPEVKTLEDAYAVHTGRPDVQDFIENKLRLSLKDFRTLMETRTLMDHQWREIDRLLQEAGRRKNKDFDLEKAVAVRRLAAAALAEAAQRQAAAIPKPSFPGPSPTPTPAKKAEPVKPDPFLEKVDAVAAFDPKFEFAGGIDEFHKTFRAVESYLAMPAESFKTLMGVALRERDPPGDDRSWDRVYEIVADAHREKIYAGRRITLLKAATLGDMITIGLGEPAPADLQKVMPRLEALGVSAEERRYLASDKPDSNRVARALELAWRNREAFVAPRAEKVEWRGWYPAAEARAAPRWKTFGAVQTTKLPMPPAAFGFAASSPLLALAEGTRTIELRLDFSPGAGEFAESLRPGLSTAKGWIESPAKGVWEDDKRRTLLFKLTLAENDSALAPLTRAVHGLDSDAPMIRLMLDPGSYGSGNYPAGRSILRVSLKVTTTGLARLSLANDQGTLDPKKPFEPFGVQPAVGSRFYLGHPEVVGKKLETLTFNFTWMGKPASLEAHYTNYGAKPAPGEKTLIAKVNLVEGRVPQTISASFALFPASDEERTLKMPADQGNPAAASTAPADVAEWNRYLVWELQSPDFQHSAYPAIALEKSLKLAAAGKVDAATAATYQINPPYTPKIKSLTLDYTASSARELNPDAKTDAGLRVFHVHAFGYRELAPEAPLPGVPLLPPLFDTEGELYVGLRNVSAPQNVSLLFQVAEGSANPDLEPAPVQWSYLSGDKWISLHDGSLLADGTRGFVNSGIVEISLKPAKPGTLMPGGLYWLRAAIARAADGVCDMIELHPNAVSATFADAGNAPDHLAVPLPAGSMSGLVTPISGIERVRQPYPSFGGKMAEQDSGFNLRVSERLRHKDRALTPWDYERLVLEKFPQLYKVKCLRADAAAQPRDPGRVELVVIPDVRNRAPLNPFEPKAPADLIRDIEAFLRERTPPFASVRVKNPHYVQVKVRCGVRFVPGRDEGYCRRRLGEELNRFLSPWAYDEGADIVIGGSVYANSIINFIDDREYVDYLFELKLFISRDGGRNFEPVPEPSAGEGYHVAAGKPDAVLVAARSHELDVTSRADYRVEGFAGVGYLQIELDLKVS